MKNLFLVFLLFFFTHARSQETNATKLLEKIIIGQFNVPKLLFEDSCYFSNSLLKFDFDENSKVISVSVSDNAEEWIVKEAGKLKAKKILKTVEDYAAHAQIKSRSLLVPVIYRNEPGNCKPGKDIYWFTKKYYTFNGKKLEGNCLFIDPVEIFLSFNN